MFFSILTRRLLKRGEFASRDHLVARIMVFMVFIADYDATARPFKWPYDGKPFKTAKTWQNFVGEAL